MVQQTIDDYLRTDDPLVLFSEDISAETIIEMICALGFEGGEGTCLKITTGEPPASNYLDPAIVLPVADEFEATLVECNTAYDGSLRADTESHLQVAESHGFKDIQIMDACGDYAAPVKSGTMHRPVIDRAFLGDCICQYSKMIVLSHFKGHAMAGFGGAIKNVGIGCQSAQGKRWVHSAGTSLTYDVTSCEFPPDVWLPAVADACKAAVDLMDSVVYVNVLNNLSVDCDCNGHPAPSSCPDIGVVAGLDPVAVDAASLELVLARPEGIEIAYRVNQKRGWVQLEEGERIGLGQRRFHMLPLSAVRREEDDEAEGEG